MFGLPLFICMYMCITQPGWPTASLPQGQTTLSWLVYPMDRSVLDVQNLWCKVPVWFNVCASRCCFQHLWMTNAWASCTSLYFQWAGMKHKVSETLISFSRSANRWYEVQMHKFYVWFKHLFVCVCVVCARCMYVQQQRAMHCELKETGWVDLSRQVPTC